MRIAIVNETSAADKNKDILTALADRDHEILNVGMKKSGEQPELQYIHTGLLSALILNLGIADLVVGGCGTGIGYMNSVMQYPGVVCGLITGPLDAWLFAQINNGNCISLQLNQGYGWASDINLRFIFDRYFSVERGRGYPEHRREPQAASRKVLKTISGITHKPMLDILTELPDEVVKPVLLYPGVLDLIRKSPQIDRDILEVLLQRL